MRKIYKNTSNFLLYSVVFAAAISVASFLANLIVARSVTQGRVSTAPIPFTPVASADGINGGTDSNPPGDTAGGGDGGGDGDSGDAGSD